MATVIESITINADPGTVFVAYTERMNEWWPWKGTYKYTFAPDGVDPDRIVMESGEGGRFYEVWSDGTEHQIGMVKVWRPSTEVVYTWEVDGWETPSIVTVRFEPVGNATKVTVEHSDLPNDGIAMGYSVGQQEILTEFSTYMNG